MEEERERGRRGQGEQKKKKKGKVVALPRGGHDCGSFTAPPRASLDTKLPLPRAQRTVLITSGVRRARKSQERCREGGGRGCSFQNQTSTRWFELEERKKTIFSETSRARSLPISRRVIVPSCTASASLACRKRRKRKKRNTNLVVAGRERPGEQIALVLERALCCHRLFDSRSRNFHLLEQARSVYWSRSRPRRRRSAPARGSGGRRRRGRRRRRRSRSRNLLGRRRSCRSSGPHQTPLL